MRSRSCARGRSAGGGLRAATNSVVTPGTGSRGTTRAIRVNIFVKLFLKTVID